MAVLLQLYAIRAAHRSLIGIEAPPELAAVHAALTDATADCDQATVYMASGIDNLSSDDIDTANVLITSCGKKLSLAAKMLKDYQTQP